MKTGYLRTFAFLAALAPSGALAADIVIGVPAWPSAQATAHIIADTLRDRFDVEPELMERGTMLLVADIGQGRAHIHPEVWLPNLEGAVARLSSNKDLLRLNPHGVPASQNICATRATLEQTGIKSVSDLTRPEIAAQFDSNADGKGEIWIGAPTWSSTEIERIRAHSYGYDRTMTLLEMPEDVAMAAVDVAVALDKPFVFYCYRPHHLFELHDIVALEEPPHDPATWHVVKRADDAGWLQKSSATTAWDASHFHVAYAASIANDLPQVARFLSAIQFEPTDITSLSYAIQVEGKPADVAAAEWLAQNADRIEEWTK